MDKFSPAEIDTIRRFFRAVERSDLLKPDYAASAKAVTEVDDGGITITTYTAFGDYHGADVTTHPNVLPWGALKGPKLSLVSKD
jgi:hypothetical protein